MNNQVEFKVITPRVLIQAPCGINKDEGDRYLRRVTMPIPGWASRSSSKALEVSMMAKACLFSGQLFAMIGKENGDTITTPVKYHRSKIDKVNHSECKSSINGVIQVSCPDRALISIKFKISVSRASLRVFTPKGDGYSEREVSGDIHEITFSQDGLLSGLVFTSQMAVKSYAKKHLGDIWCWQLRGYRFEMVGDAALVEEWERQQIYIPGVNQSSNQDLVKLQKISICQALMVPVSTLFTIQECLKADKWVNVVLTSERAYVEQSIDAVDLLEIIFEGPRGQRGILDTTRPCHLIDENTVEVFFKGNPDMQQLKMSSARHYYWPNVR